MKILVLATDYPRPDGYVSQFFIHTRNKEYVNSGLNITVMSFNATNDYIIDGVNVITQTSLSNRMKYEAFDILVSHAPNLRNHYRFLMKYGNRFKRYIFFFHGHEVLRNSEVYPKPYPYTKKALSLYKVISEVYDTIKLFIWRNFYKKYLDKSDFVFVSNWMYKMFLKFVKIDYQIIKDKIHIIYNSIGLKFEKETYNKDRIKKYDFITIRNNLDGSKYSIDIVKNIAEHNPQYSFCVIGRGEFFNYYKKPDNIVWIDKSLSHDEIIDFLNRAKCALLPTRTDAQGVMACEMATFGIPLITSNIDVCKEVFEEFENVAFIDNEEKYIDIKPILQKLLSINIKEKNEKYFTKNTVRREIELFMKLRD